MNTPRTNKALAVLLERDGELSEDNAPAVLVKLCKELERERDEALTALMEIEVSHGDGSATPTTQKS